jgi:hypothetical protein
VDLAVAPPPPPLPGAPPPLPPLLAAATAGGGVLLLQWGAGGAGATVARACGRAAGGGGQPSGGAGEGELAPPPRVCWLPARHGGAPYYLAVANGGGEGASISVVSAGTGGVVAALRGHAGVVKGLAAWPGGSGGGPLLLSCGFDKNVIAWGK